jgi:hypothetical protein
MSGSLAGRPLQLNFLGHSRDGISGLVDNRLQDIDGYAEPPRPGPNLRWVCEVDLITNGRMFYALHGEYSLAAGSTTSERLRSMAPENVIMELDLRSIEHCPTTLSLQALPCKPWSIRQRPPEGGPVRTNHRSRRSVVIDDDLAAVVIDVPIMIALLDDDRVMIAVIAVANYIAVAHDVDIAVAMTLANGHADRADTNAYFFRKRRQGSSDHRGSRYR